MTLEDGEEAQEARILVIRLVHSGSENCTGSHSINAKPRILSSNKAACFSACFYVHNRAKRPAGRCLLERDM